jgi:Skp family chaperone for outer membrane proteins
MKVIRSIFAAAALAAFAALAASAQTTPAQRPAPTPAGPAQTGGAIAEGRFAVVDTDAFTDQKQGIRRLVAAFQTVEREFKPRRDELQQLQTRYEALAKQISDTQKVSDQKALASLADQAETLKTDIEQKQAAGQKALDKRVKELTEPIYQDIGNALQAFARGRGISVVFDISKMQGVVMLINPAGVDITDAFIADYNQRNPASTASTTPPAKP